MTIKTLDEIKSDLIKLSISIDCDKLIMKECYSDSGVIYSILYNKPENSFYKFIDNEAPVLI